MENKRSQIDKRKGKAIFSNLRLFFIGFNSANVNIKYTPTSVVLDTFAKAFGVLKSE